MTGEPAVADGYRMLATILGVGLDTYLYADQSRPVFVDTVTPFRRDRRWGGDNTDAYYSSRRRPAAHATGSPASAATAPTSR